MLNKRAQVTLFIILAIVIIGLVVVVFFFPQVQVTSQEVNPSSYLRDCIEQPLEEIKEVLSEQGGYSDPTNFVLYQDQQIQYLCYTSENYVPCVVQQPLLLNHIESEIEQYIQPRASQCVRDLEEQYTNRGYSVSSALGNTDVEIVSGAILLNFNSPLTVTKETTQTFQNFAVSTSSGWYDLISTAVNIIQFESTLGDSETGLYLQYYPNLKIVKTKRNGDKIYELTDVTTNDKFTFASRSLVWPQGLQ